ncbi:CHAT domain-containing protein [Xylaria arbuscula]|nr:CHAT domain-containing protein [Xylaria arbuscula]
MSYTDLDEYISELYHKGIRYTEEYWKSNSDADLRSAIEYLRDAFKRASDSHPEKPRIAHRLARRLLDLYQRQPDPVDLENAEALGRFALEHAKENDPDRVIMMNGLSLILREKNTTIPNIQYLEEAAQLTREAINHEAGTSMKARSFMTNLASILSELYASSGKDDYIYEAVNWNRKVVLATDLGDPMKPARLTNLANKLNTLFDISNEVKYIEEAVEYDKQAAFLITKSTDQVNYPNIINCYGIRLRLFFESTGDKASLHQSVKCLKDLAETMPRTHQLWITVVNNLCNALILKHEEDGSVADLQNAMEAAQDAISQAEKHNSPSARSTLMNTLCLAIRLRYKMTGALRDLEEAMTVAERVTELTPESPVEYASAMQNKASTLEMLYFRRRRESDLEAAIKCNETAAKKTSQKRCLAKIYGNLGIQYGYRFENYGNITNDLQMAIDCCRKCISLGENSFSSYSNLASWLHVSSQSHKDDSPLGLASKRDELDESIRLAEKGFSLAQATPARSDLSRAALTLARGLNARFRDPHEGYGGKGEDRSRVKEILQCILTESNNSAPTDQIQVAISLAQIASRDNDSELVYTALSKAVEFLPFLSPQCISQVDQHHFLSLFAGLSSEAAASAIVAGRSASEALQLLEDGRCVTSRHRFERRIDISRLRSMRPELSQKFEHLCSILDAPQVGHSQEYGGGSSLSQRHRAETDLRTLINQIREEVDFKEFLKPADPCALLRGKPRSAIAVINISFRSGAFLAKEDEVTYVDLPGLNSPTFDEMIRRFATKFSSVLGQLDIYEELEWLWDTVVNPILGSLGISSHYTEGEWFHVHWVPTASLSRLPLHAAGYHRDGSLRTTLDWVVSSYSPSIKFLQYAADNTMMFTRRLGRVYPKALIGSMTHTPSMPSLPEARKEAKSVGRQLQPSMCINEVDTPSRSYLINELQYCTFFHFAGHGKADATDPLQSSLHVADGLITVQELIDLRLNLSPPVLAYLSACLTGNTRVDNLIDEGVHLAASFLAMGFQNVVAALWQVRDRDSSHFADHFYHELTKLKSIPSPSTPASVSLALHQAQRKLRGMDRLCSSNQRGFTRPQDTSRISLGRSFAWICYIHLGHI